MGFIGALATYNAQRALDRQHAILAERRKLYEECAAVIAAHMFKQVNIESEQHFLRRDNLNQVGQRIFVIAPRAVRSAFSAVVEHLSEKERFADDEGIVHQYFDDKAKSLVDHMLDE